ATSHCQTLSLSLHDALPSSKRLRFSSPPRVLMGIGTTMAALTTHSLTRSTASSRVHSASIPTCASPSDSAGVVRPLSASHAETRSEEHTSELQSRENLVCRL